MPGVDGVLHLPRLGLCSLDEVVPMGSKGPTLAYIRFFILFANKLKPRCKRLLVRVALSCADQVRYQGCYHAPHYISRTSYLSRVGECHGAAAQSMEAIGIGSGLGLVDRD
jgi:hypothetical protein